MAAAAIEAAFDDLGWGMTERQVRVRYPKAIVAVPGIVVVMQDKIGGAAKLPITVRFHVRDGLSQISVMVQRNYLDDASIDRDEVVLRAWVAKRAGIVLTKGEKFTTENSTIIIAYDDDVLGAWWEPLVEKPPKKKPRKPRR